MLFQEEEFGGVEVEAEGDSDYALSAMSSSKKSRKGRISKHGGTPSTPVASDSGSGELIKYLLLINLHFIPWM